METASTGKRNITREDILLQMRLGRTGARVTVNGPMSWTPSMYVAGPRMVLDGCDMVMSLGLLSNERSPFEIVVDGRSVTISEDGEVVATAKLEPKAAWREMKLADGTPVENVILCTDDIQSNIIISRGCHTAARGKACHFCSLGNMFETEWTLASAEETLATAQPQIEATVIAIENGWRGFLNLAGGAAPPDKRGKWTTDMIEAVMERFHQSIDAEALSELQIAVQVYPPDDLAEMEKWKSFGINSSEFDNQVLDPAYFKAVCRGRGEQQRWFEAEEASVEIFGRGRGTISNLVTGLEPMAGMLEGIEERISKGVYSFPLIFGPAPGTPLEGMQPPTIEWYMESFDKITDIYLRYADTMDVDLTEDDRWGYTRRGQSNMFTPFKNVWISRLQEMGKMPPGLPNQYGVEVT